MAKRKRMGRRISKRVFRAGVRVHPKNSGGRPMRGGIRL